MKKLNVFILVLLLATACKQKHKQSTDEEMFEAVGDTTIIRLELSPFLEKVNSYDGKICYETNLEYSGKTLQIIGRTSGITSEGYLLLQAESGENPIYCYDLDSDFLLNVNKEDIVRITGDFEIEDIGNSTYRHGVLRNCVGEKIQ